MAETHTIILPIKDALVSMSDGAEIDLSGEHPKILFDTGTDENARWSFRFPENYASGLTIKIQYSMASATSGTVAWSTRCNAESDVDGVDLDAAPTWGTDSDSSATVPGTAGHLDEISDALNDDSLAGGDFFRIELERDTVTDSAAGDAEVVAVSLEYSD